MRLLLCCSLTILLLTVTPGWGDDPMSGPPVGKAVPPLKVFDATGPQKGKELDYCQERKERPTVYVLIQADKWDRPMARFLKELDKLAQPEQDAAAIVAVWLTDDREKTKDYLPIAQQSIQLQATALTCFTGGKEGPENWDINLDAHLTAVVVKQGKVAAAFGFRSVNETNVRAVRRALQAEKTEKSKD